MNEDAFWKIIESFDLLEDGINPQPAIDILSQMTEQDLRDFDEILAEKLYALDTQAHGIAVGFGVDHFSVDLFLYKRCCVVANGREFYELVLKNPSEMPQDLEYEDLLNLTYSAAVEKGLEDYRHSTKLSYETFSNAEGWQNAKFPDALPLGHKPKHQREK
jgi:hypothetical protein